MMCSLWYVVYGGCGGLEGALHGALSTCSQSNNKRLDER